MYNWLLLIIFIHTVEEEVDPERGNTGNVTELPVLSAAQVVHHHPVMMCHVTDDHVIVDHVTDVTASVLMMTVVPHCMSRTVRMNLWQGALLVINTTSTECQEKSEGKQHHLQIGDQENLGEFGVQIICHMHQITFVPRLSLCAIVGRKWTL